MHYFNLFNKIVSGVFLLCVYYKLLRSNIHYLNYVTLIIIVKINYRVRYFFLGLKSMGTFLHISQVWHSGQAIQPQHLLSADIQPNKFRQMFV